MHNSMIAIVLHHADFCLVLTHVAGVLVLFLLESWHSVTGVHHYSRDTMLSVVCEHIVVFEH